MDGRRMKSWRWRPLRLGDLDALMSIVVHAFPAHYEGPACYVERLTLGPAWCFALEDEAHAVKGYLVAYPWPLHSIPPLNTLLGSLPEQGRAILLHDLALHPDAVGTGQAKVIVERLAGQARAAGFELIALVSVNDATGFWRRNGFEIVEGDAALRDKLASYGEGAHYMVRTIGDQPG